MSAQTSTEEAPHPLIGQVVGKHRITRLIGMGGMGAVFEAVHETINQRVAIKVLHAKLTADPASVQRFLKEAQTTSKVHHVGLVRVFDSGQLPDGAAYMMMEFLEGESLKARLKSVEKLPVADALRITRQIAAALASAHEKGVIHRDLKPENILLVPDPETPSGERTKVLDFGIAKVMEPEGSEVMKTTTGAILGTPTYMSPEQCRGIGQTNEKSDVYSLGAILYEMLAGRPPFIGSGSGDLIAMHIMEKPQPLRDLAPNVSPDVETLVHQMLEKKPETRPSMRQVLAGLEQLGQSSTASGFMSSVVIVQPPPGMTAEAAAPAAPREKKSNALPIIIGAIGVIAVAAMFFVMRPPPAPPVRPTPVEPTTQSPTTTTKPTLPAPLSLSIASVPAGAQVVRASDQTVLGVTPWKQEHKSELGSLEVLVRMKGYHDQRLVFEGKSDEAREIKLVPAPPIPTGPVGPNPPPVDPLKKNVFVKKPPFQKVFKPNGPGKKDDDLVVPVVR